MCWVHSNIMQCPLPTNGYSPFTQQDSSSAKPWKVCWILPQCSLLANASLSLEVRITAIISFTLGFLDPWLSAPLDCKLCGDRDHICLVYHRLSLTNYQRKEREKEGSSGRAYSLNPSSTFLLLEFCSCRSFSPADFPSRWLEPDFSPKANLSITLWCLPFFPGLLWIWSWLGWFPNTVTFWEGPCLACLYTPSLPHPRPPGLGQCLPQLCWTKFNGDPVNTVGVMKEWFLF